MFDVKKVSELYKIFEDSDIGEIEIKNANNKIKIILGNKPITQFQTNLENIPKKELLQKEQEPQGEKENRELDNIVELKSNWVGYFTRLNPKTGENYVKLRDNVKKGMVVGHVRVLGVLQDLKAEVDGKVKEILVEEGQPIEYGQPIMRFEKL